MKLLIIAGPYEADRIRRAAVAAHFETVAIEPGESLSGWISASRPDAIVMVPRMVNPDPTVALAKIRSVPRGRVPIFLVGDADDEERLRGLADGFFVRPIFPEDLIEQARARLARDGEEAAASGVTSEGVVRADVGDGSDNADFARPTPTPKSGPHAAKSSGGLKPLVASGEPSGEPISAEPMSAAAMPAPGALSSRARDSSSSGRATFDLFSQLAESIDESLEADIQDVVRELAVGSELAHQDRNSDRNGDRNGDGDGDDDSNDALEELRDESSQKTVEVPSEVVAKMMRGGAGGEGDGEASHDDASHDDAPHDEPRTRARRRPGRDAASASVTARIEILPAPSERGPIGSPDIAALLGRIFSAGLTGALAFRRGEVEKTIVFLHGAPLSVRSNLVEDRMGEMLVRQGRVTARQRDEGAAAVAAGRRLGGVLVERGVLKASELAPLVRRHFEQLLFSLFAWAPSARDGDGNGDGEWTLGPDVPDQVEDIGIVEPIPALILEGIRRKQSAAHLLACLAAAAAAMRERAPDAASDVSHDVLREVFRLRDGIGTTRVLEKMALTEAERAIVALFDGVRSLGEIRALADQPAGLPEATVFGVAWALMVLGRLERVAALGSAAGAEPRTPSPDDAAGAGPGEGERDRAIDRARVLARYELVCEGDYFQLLGLPRDASSHEVMRAYQTLARELSAQALHADIVAELGAELRAIRAVVDEGARVLGDARMRQRYLTHLPETSLSPSSSPTSSSSSSVTSGRSPEQ